ncbi:MAG: FAD:protein FMN transferase [Candidatus Omnitrophica bacterium]|nr:FAD:protein FMN transferase [Candidatus Omnitrophota bacterium]
MRNHARIFLMLLYFFALSCSGSMLYKDTALLMGTYVEVVSPTKEAAEIVFREIKRIELLLSKYNSQSEIFYLNQYGKAKVSPDTFYVIKKAKEFFEYSRGAFDITVGVLLKVWGFNNYNYRVPNEKEIEGAKELVGSDKILLDEEKMVIEFQKKGMLIDLGAIAKGYAVDCAIKKLKENGIKSALINAGGDIYCLGDKFGKAWQVGIRDPKTKKIRKVLRLTDKAVATSGDYEVFFIHRDRRFSHIFDPRKGRPVDAGISSVTIVANDCLTADALATAVFVMGKERAEELMSRFNARIEDIVVYQGGR